MSLLMITEGKNWCYSTVRPLQVAKIFDSGQLYKQIWPHWRVSKRPISKIQFIIISKGLPYPKTIITSLHTYHYSKIIYVDVNPSAQCNYL